MSTYNWDTTGEEVANDLSAQIAGKTVFITGVSPGGLGASFASIIAKHKPACLILATRDISKAEEVVKEFIATSGFAGRIHYVSLNLGSLTEVRKAGQEINALGENIDVIVNNAAIMAAPFAKTVDGLESQFAINHIGHFLLTNLLLPKILARKAPVRIVNVSSEGHRLGHVRFEDLDFDDGKTYDPWSAYGQAKSANMLFSVALANKLGSQGVVSLSLHPGVIGTQLGRHLVASGHIHEAVKQIGEVDHALGNKSHWEAEYNYKSPSQGVATHIFAAFYDGFDSETDNGSYLDDCHITDKKKLHAWARDPIDAEKLWTLTEDIVGQKFDF